MTFHAWQVHACIRPLSALTKKAIVTHSSTPKFQVLSAERAQAKPPRNAGGCLPCLGSDSGLDLDPHPQIHSAAPSGALKLLRGKGPRTPSHRRQVNKIEPEPETPGYRPGDILREQDGQRLSLPSSSASWVPPDGHRGSLLQEGFSILGPSLYRKLRPRPAPSGVYPPPICRVAHSGLSPIGALGSRLAPTQ